MSYIGVLKTAVLVFPFIAFLFTFPYMLRQYHKYGSIPFLRSLIIYSFILYMLSAYFLVILPLPPRSSVALLTTPRVRIELFGFIKDFINDCGIVLTDYHTYIGALKKPCFYVPLFNIFLTLPFGIYLRYYFKCSFKKTVIYSFLLSLFYELTQLSGLYFIYPRGYRLFDLDDLFLNTIGGICGYFTAFLFMKFLPSRDKIDNMSYEAGKKVSFIKRMTAYCLDFIIYIIACSMISISISKYIFIIPLILYYIFLPYFTDGKTLGYMFLNLKIVSNDDKKLSIFRMFLRIFLGVLTYFLIPICFIYVCFIGYSYIPSTTRLRVFLAMFIFLSLCIYYLVIFIKLLRRKIFMYELFSHTKMVSTIDEKMKKETNE